MIGGLHGSERQPVKVTFPVPDKKVGNVSDDRHHELAGLHPDLHLLDTVVGLRVEDLVHGLLKRHRSTDPQGPEAHPFAA